MRRMIIEADARGVDAMRAEGAAQAVLQERVGKTPPLQQQRTVGNSVKNLRPERDSMAVYLRRIVETAEGHAAARSRWRRRDGRRIAWRHIAETAVWKADASRARSTNDAKIRGRSSTDHVPRARAERRLFGTFYKVGLCLDTAPYPGHTTTLDSLWVGVPVVTLARQTWVSILSNIGLHHLIAAHPDEYVTTAKTIAGDLNQLSELRRSLRDRMQASPLMDAPRFTANLEEAYLQIWRERSPASGT